MVIILNNVVIVTNIRGWLIYETIPSISCNDDCFVMNVGFGSSFMQPLGNIAKDPVLGWGRAVRRHLA